MSVKTDVWMPLYVGDYLRDTQRLSLEAHGAYMLLIMDYWISGPPDDDDEQIARILRISREKWGKIKAQILPFFVSIDGQLRHPRIDREKSDSMTNRLNAKIKGAKGAQVRWERVKQAKKDS